MLCGDVRAGFVSGKNFTRELGVKLPHDCAALLGVEAPCFMRTEERIWFVRCAPAVV